MNKGFIAGAAKETTGAIKEVLGRMSGDARLTARGVSERAAGRLQYARANAREVIRR